MRVDLGRPKYWEWLNVFLCPALFLRIACAVQCFEYRHQGVNIWRVFVGPTPVSLSPDLRSLAACPGHQAPLKTRQEFWGVLLRAVPQGAVLLSSADEPLFRPYGAGIRLQISLAYVLCALWPAQCRRLDPVLRSLWFSCECLPSRLYQQTRNRKKSSRTGREDL